MCEGVFAPLQDSLLVKGISYNLFIFSEEKNKEWSIDADMLFIDGSTEDEIASCNGM